MRVLKYLFALWIIIAVYCGFSLLAGSHGISAYKQLIAERGKQWENMKNIGAINEELENTKNSLLYDQDAIAVYARQMGYSQDGERFFRIVGLGGIQNPHAAAGQVFFAGVPDSISDKTIKIIAFCTGLAVLAVLFIMDILRSQRD